MTAPLRGLVVGVAARGEHFIGGGVEHRVGTVEVVRRKVDGPPAGGFVVVVEGGADAHRDDAVYLSCSVVGW